METKLSPHALTERLLAEAETLRDTRAESNPLLVELRNKALESFRKQGIPTKKTEEYRYIDFASFLHDDMRVEVSKPELYPSVEAHSFIDAAAPTLFLINGYFEPSLSRNCDGITALSLADAINQRNADVLSHLGLAAEVGQDPLADINTACFCDGLFLKIAKRSQFNQIIQIVQLSSAMSPVLINPRILILAEQGCEAEVVHLSTAGLNSELTFSNTVIEVHLEAEAQLRLSSIQHDAGLSSVCNTIAHVAKGANLQHVSISLEGKLIRNNLQAVLTESGSEANLHGYYHPTEKSLFDNHTLVDHRQPHCQSNELYKGVVDGKATAVFNGKIYVRKNAQKTNAFQSNKNILLSADATVNTKPQLEIYADDVKCSHGSSTGLLDPDQLFYLRARGISLPKAKALLLHAYAGEILSAVHSDFHREALRSYLEQRFEA